MEGSSPQTIFISALIIIAIGYLVRKSGLLSREHGGVLAKLVLNVTLPALIIRTVPQIAFTPSLLFLPLLALLHSAVAFGVVQLLFRKRSYAERGIITICSMGFNNGLFAFPIAQEIWGIEAVKLLAIFDLGNGLIILGGNYVIASYFAGGGQIRFGEALKVVGRTLATSVPMITLLFALVLNVTGFELPPPVGRTVSILASANGALALLVLGMFQSLSFRPAEIPTIAKVLSLRYLLGILFVLATVSLLGETLMLRRVLSIVFILPIGMTVIPFSVAFGLDTRLATTMVNLTIILSFALMWVSVLIVG